MTTVSCKGARRIVDAINEAGSEGRKALAAFLTAGYPTHDRFADILADVADEADLIEIGVPFSDPVADGVTIQQSSRLRIDKSVARYLGEYVEHSLIEHIPRADLLFDHIFASLIEIHCVAYLIHKINVLLYL